MKRRSPASSPRLVQRAVLALLFFMPLMVSRSPATTTVQDPAIIPGDQSESQVHYNQSASGDTLIPYSGPDDDPGLSKGTGTGYGATRIRIGSYSFQNETMSDAYDKILSGSIEYLSWHEKFGLSFELGFFGGDGTPNPIDPNWDVSESNVDMNAFSLGVNVLYRFMNSSNKEFLEPYVALGPALWLGQQRLSASASRNQTGIVDGFKAELQQIGLCFGGCAIAGSTFRIINDLRALIEVRWVLTGSGSTLDLSEEDDVENFDGSLKNAVQSPDFDFTGWQVAIGLQW
jgi:hypothetical protein